MKILVLDDEFHVLKGPFDYLNIKYYAESLEIENYSKTQDFTKMENIDEYDRIFVDISLHRQSEQDGYSFVSLIKDKVSDIGKIVIITGSDRVAQRLNQIGLSTLKVLTKPITFIDLKKCNAVT